MDTIQTACQAHSGETSEEFDLRAFNPLGEHVADPYPLFAYARKHEPVFYSEALHAWCVTRHSDIVDVVSDPETYSSREAFPRPQGLPPEAEEVAQWLWQDAPAITFLDPPEHTRVRSIVRNGFTPRALAAFEPGVRKIVEEYADRLAGRDRVDLVAEFAEPLPLSVVMHVIGVPTDHHGMLKSWFDKILTIIISSAFVDRDVLVDAGVTHRQCMAYLRELIEDRTADPRDDLISFMIHHDVKGMRLEPAEIASQVFSLLTAGTETTGNALSNTVRALLERPDRWADLVHGRISVDTVAAEGLRYDSPILGLFRIATRDTELGGKTIPAGSMLFLLFASACHDEAKYDAPEQFDHRRPGLMQHLGFGHGIHYCVGAPLAKMELTIALDVLASRFPNMRLDSSGPAVYKQKSQFRALESLWVRL